ncbi:Cytochrome c oxidase subunit 2 precursor [Gemmata obscuriglobus]|uniref:Cytochrome c oxidase subunit 2 n=1 Tax=Gemmata obscuriglobus TaxID=114 RepID=A0A2Z3GXJ0_9BACT|nr:cytochrome c oxidase subunit II [Gemmata obscuriglobus]AWM36126.1 cytochrome c oxidase subunit II [Gemmata obscuriglobus]QEG31285.1 Cytochrome c oxidase subunit 2 precursor [Gemmata obscuriglobus]VTS10624.1 cytochrome c subunit ii : Cytochrome c oxidase subunit 2 OS=Koribacter versatilis (strain Ellin345) GN=Acid345_2996 PE=3 SV=1: COX2: Cytochrom_C [Gemmata obscuriglobus UQM 2246]
MNLLPLVPERASTLADQFEFLFWYMSITMGLVGLGVYAALAYFCVRYRRGQGTGSTPRILGSTRLELTWTIIPLFVFLTFYAWGVMVYDHHTHAPADAEEVFIIGKQWMWKAQYANGQRVIIGGNPRNMTEAERNSIGKLVLPINRPVKLTLTSEDVIHDFGVPAFRSKVDVLPGRYTSVWYQPTKLGEYHIYCDQYCGTWHSLMVGKIAVVQEDEYRKFLQGYEPLQGSDNPVDGSLAQQGQQLFLKLQCINCHSADAKARAPVLEGLYGSTVPLAGGGKEVADDHYIIESIRRPRLKQVEGWEKIMPAYDESQVSADEMNALVAYIRKLGRGQTPKNNQQFPPPVGAPTTPTERGTTSPEKK